MCKFCKFYLKCTLSVDRHPLKMIQCYQWYTVRVIPPPILISNEMFCFRFSWKWPAMRMTEKSSAQAAELRPARRRPESGQSRWTSDGTFSVETRRMWQIAAMSQVDITFLHSWYLGIWLENGDFTVLHPVHYRYYRVSVIKVGDGDILF